MFIYLFVFGEFCILFVCIGVLGELDFLVKGFNIEVEEKLG